MYAPDPPDPNYFYVDTVDWYFNTDTYEVTSSTVNTYGVGVGNDFPGNEAYYPGEVLVTYCTGTTLHSYIGTSEYNVVQHTTLEDAPDCGGGGTQTGQCPLKISYTTNAALTELTLVPDAGTFTGPLRHSKDGGTTWQDSGTFGGLVTATYNFISEDLGVTAIRCFVTTTVVNVLPTGPTDPPPTGGGGTTPPADTLPAPATTGPTALHYVEAPVWLKITGYDPYQYVQLQLVCEKTQHRSGEFEIIYTGRKYVEADGAAYFRVDEILRAQCRREIPRQNDGVPYFDVQMLRNFYGISARVRSTGALTAPVPTSLQTAVLAALPRFENWLTNQPDTKVAARTDAEFLYFQLSSTPPPNFHVCRQVVKASTGGLAQAPPITYQAVVTATSGRPPGFRCLVVPVLLAEYGADVLQVNVWLQFNDGQRMAPTRSYKIETRGANTPRSFLFANPFGGVDTLTTIGAGQVKLQADQDTAARGRLANDTRSTAQEYIYSLEPKRTFKVGSGWLTAAQRHWLQGFILARKVWFLRRAAWVPIVATKRELVYETDSKQLDALTFEFELASDLAHLSELT